MMFYRLEVTTIHGSKNGPFLLAEWKKLHEPLKSICDEMFREHMNSWRPKPRVFGDPKLGPKCRCACVSISALKDWFGDWMPLILHYGGEIVAFDVPKDGILEQDDYQVTYLVSKVDDLR